RIHPQVGAEIIGGVPFPYPVAPLILSHHERWDGNGYPAGLAAEAIPLGARILTVVDYFDALTSERPFQRPVNPEVALELLREESGKALDPTLVETFIRLYPQLAAEAETEEDHPKRQVTVDAPDAFQLAAAGVAVETSSHGSVFQDIALA